MGLYTDGGAPGFIMSVFGAMLLLALYRLVMRKRSVN